jgi:hypothetical protein
LEHSVTSRFVIYQSVRDAASDNVFWQRVIGSGLDAVGVVYELIEDRIGQAAAVDELTLQG